MRFSKLQKYILLLGLESKNHKIAKNSLLGFYQKSKIKLKDQINIVTKSVERLIEKGIAKCLGVKTKEKWFIKEVTLTSEGLKRAKALLGQQQKLPLKNFKK